MSSIAKLRAAGSTVKLSAEEEARTRAAVLAVQREMEDADEPNFLEEEDMYVFDREPLTDELNLVSCNMCKAPIKDSQFAAHAERCRALNAQDDPITELDGGAGHKKPPRQARKKLPSQDTINKGLCRRAQACSTDCKEETGFVVNYGPTLLEAPLGTMRSLGSVDSISELDTQVYSEPLSKASSRLSPGVDSVCECIPNDSQCIKHESESKSPTVEKDVAEIPMEKVTVKKRKKRDIGAGDSERLQAAEEDDLAETAGVSGGAYEDQPPLYSSNPRGTKKVMKISEGTVVAAPKVGRPRKAVVIAPGEAGAAAVAGAGNAGVAQPPSKRPKILTTEELDTLCGVLNSQTGMMCRRSITCKLHSETNKRAVLGRRRPYDTLLREFKANKLAAASFNTVAVANPLPLATKEYCPRPDHCMRAVLGSLFSDACNRRAVNRGNSPDRLSGEFGGQVLPALTLPSDQSSDLQTCQLSGFNQKKSANLKEKESQRDDKNAPPVQVMQMARVKAEPGINQAVDYARLNMTGMGYSGASNYQHLDNRLGMAGVPVDYGHLVMNKGRTVQGLPVLGTNVPGTSHAW